MLAMILIAMLPYANAKGGIVLAPKTEQEHQAAQLLIQGATLMKAKKPFAARPLIERAATMWPTSSHVYFNLGLCYGEIGQFPKAIEAYERALKLDRKLTECIPNIASCYQLMNQPAEAIQWFEEYLRRDPHAPDAAQVRGMIVSLSKHPSDQVASNPQTFDYLASVSPEGRIQRWPRTKVPLKIFISSGTDESGRHVRGFREYYNEILIDAFEAWMKASQNRLAYTIVDNVQDANIVCTWTDRTDFLKEKGNSVEQGAARVTARQISEFEEEIAFVRVIVLVTDVQGRGNISDDTLKKACLHEIGHALGFAGHSNNNRDVMFFSESPTVWAALTKRDKATMARLYSDYPMQSIPDQLTPETAAQEAAPQYATQSTQTYAPRDTQLRRHFPQ